MQLGVITLIGILLLAGVFNGRTDFVEHTGNATHPTFASSVADPKGLENIGDEAALLWMGSKKGQPDWNRDDRSK